MVGCPDSCSSTVACPMESLITSVGSETAPRTSFRLKSTDGSLHSCLSPCLVVACQYVMKVVSSESNNLELHSLLTEDQLVPRLRGESRSSFVVDENESAGELPVPGLVRVASPVAFC